MDSIFIWAQIIGFVAMTITAMSWQLKNPRHIILSEAPITILWVMQYLMLEGYIGAFINLLIGIRAIGLTYAKESQLFLILCIYTIIVWGFGLYGFQGWHDLLPLIATTGGSFILFHRDNRPLIGRGIILTQFLWIAYNLVIGSWMGIGCSIFVIISSTIGMYRYEEWILGRCHRTFIPSLARSLFVFPNFRTYP